MPIYKLCWYFIFNFDLFLYVIDILRTIKDPEKPGTLEDLDIVYETGIDVFSLGEGYLVEIQYKYYNKIC